MVDEVVVWNLDVRNRPELEVEIEIIRASPPRVRAAGTQPLSTRALLDAVDIPFIQLEDLMAEPFVEAFVADDGSVVVAA